MKICIVGCGAIGSIFGAHLARVEGVEVHAYDVSQAHVDAINKNGLRISGAADFTARLHATTDAKQIPPCDYGIVATKSTHTRPRHRANRPHLRAKWRRLLRAKRRWQ